MLPPDVSRSGSQMTVAGTPGLSVEFHSLEYRVKNLEDRLRQLLGYISHPNDVRTESALLWAIQGFWCWLAQEALASPLPNPLKRLSDNIATISTVQGSLIDTIARQQQEVRDLRAQVASLANQLSGLPRP